MRMKIGFVMPVSWEPLLPFLPEGVRLPEPLKFEFGSNLAAELRRRGHEVHVFTLCQMFEGERHVTGDGIHVHIGGYRRGAWRYTLDFYRAESAMLSKMLKEHPCEILHAHWTYEFALPVVRSAFKHVVSVRDAPWRVLWLFTPKSFRLMRLVLAYYVIARAKNLLAASPYMANYCRRWHMCRRPIRVIPNAIMESSSAPERTGVPPSDAQVDPSPVVFAAIANGFFGCKNVPKLLMAFSQLRQRTAVPCELRLYGWGSEPDGAGAAWASERGLAEGVVFCGKLAHHDLFKEVPRHAHVFVHPSLEESFGNVIVEAMSMGLPTIVGKHSGAAPWVAGEGQTGLVVDVRKPAELARAMQTMAEDAAFRSAKAAAAIELVRSRYLLDSVVTQHERLYSEILAQGVTG